MSNKRGADLNRNHIFKWDCCDGSSDDPCDSSYHGASPESEPETQAVEKYLLGIIPDQRPDDTITPAPLNTTGIIVDLHSYGEALFYPWGFDTSLPAPNEQGLKTLVRKYGYFSGYRNSLNHNDGTLKDMGYGLLGAPTFTIELGKAFFQDCTYFENNILTNNFPGLLYLAKVCRTPYITTSGPEGVNLTINGHTLTATMDDTRFLNSDGPEPSQNIAAAEYYIDVPPWQNNAVSHPLNPADGAYDCTIENVTAVLNTSGLASGRHMIFVRGQDSSGTWGAFSAVFLEVQNQTMDCLAGSFTEMGLWIWNPNDNSWGKWNSLTASQLAAGDMDGDGKEDLLGVFAAGLWLRSATGIWTKMAVDNPQSIALGDVNGGGQADIAGVWAGSGLWVRYSETGIWALILNKDANQIACADFDQDGQAEILGWWSPEGLWMYDVADGKWTKILDEANLTQVSSGDMNGDGQADMLGNWTFGVWYYNLANSVWTRLYDSADMIAAGDLNGGGSADLIGEWPAADGLWVRYSENATWYKIHDRKPTCFTAGKLK